MSPCPEGVEVPVTRFCDRARNEFAAVSLFFKCYMSIDCASHYETEIVVFHISIVMTFESPRL
jgi:hypothetical protein